MTHSYMRHDSFIYETWLSHMCNMTRHDAFLMKESRLTHERVTPHTWKSHASHMREECIVTSHVTHVTESCLIYEWVMSHEAWLFHEECIESCHTSYMRHDSFLYETWLIPIWDMTHSYMRVTPNTWGSHVTHRIWMIYRMSHVSYMNESCLMYGWVMSHMWMSHVSYIHSNEWVMSHSYGTLSYI